MDLVVQKDKCCGCTACAGVCPKNAITMRYGKNGFAYPKINEELCVDCGLCLKHCAFQNGYQTRKDPEASHAYGARHKEEAEVMKSRSGAAFVAFSDYILENGGHVYGAGYDDEEGFFKIVHKCADTPEQRDELRGSKYVQSELGDTFKKIKTQLQNGELVLFSGTGCQVGGLYAFLDKEYDNLFTIDIVCHGTPSQKMWRDFLHMREKELGGRITSVSFRDKGSTTWTEHFESVEVKNKKYVSRIYSKLFSMNFLRPSCYNCIYTNKDRVGDVTIADFWGHTKIIGEKWNDEKGISLVMVNTKQGEKLWENSCDCLETVDVTDEPFTQKNLTRPTTKPKKYNEFWRDYNDKGFDFIVEKYAEYKPQSHFKIVLNSIFKRK